MELNAYLQAERKKRRLTTGDIRCAKLGELVRIAREGLGLKHGALAARLGKEDIAKWGGLLAGFERGTCGLDAELICALAGELGIADADVRAAIDAEHHRHDLQVLGLAEAGRQRQAVRTIVMRNFALFGRERERILADPELCDHDLHGAFVVGASICGSAKLTLGTLVKIMEREKWQHACPCGGTAYFIGGRGGIGAAFSDFCCAKCLRQDTRREHAVHEIMSLPGLRRDERCCGDLLTVVRRLGGWLPDATGATRAE